MSEISEEKVGQEADGEEINAGYVRELEELTLHEARHRAETAKKLALRLVWIMAISVGAHYTTTIFLTIEGKAETVESLAQIFNMWFPVIASFVGAATTYYFTKEKS